MKDYKSLILNLLAIGGTALQTEHVFQIISLILTCVSVAIALMFNLYKWYKTAKADGKITLDELDDAISEVSDAVTEIKENVDKIKNGDADNE